MCIRDSFYTDAQVRDAVKKAEETLGSRGRIVVRPSGTEPLLRVMVEGEDSEEIQALAQQIAEIMCDRLEGEIIG